jgi:hypothetical protein
VADLTAIAAAVDARADARLELDVERTRVVVLEALEAFGADDATKRAALVALLLDDEADAADIATALPWTRTQREALEISLLRAALGVQIDGAA